MKIQKAAPASSGIKVLLLALGLIGLADASSAATAGRADSALPSVAAPTILGGVSLSRSLPWQPAGAYRIDAVALAYSPLETGRLASTAPAGIDPIETAAIVPGVFGSVALSMHNFPVAAHWAPVYKAIIDCTAGSPCDRKNSAFGEIVEIASNKGFREKLSFINSSINRLIAYKSDMAVYGQLDHWATPSEVLQHRAGDCEDFAILKMTALLRAGIPARSMSLVVLQDRRRKFFHAVVSVSTGSGNFILDSLSNLVLADTQLPDYVPLYSFSTDRAWIHGSKTGTQVADIAGGLSAVAPGEGTPEISVASGRSQ